MAFCAVLYVHMVDPQVDGPTVDRGPGVRSALFFIFGGLDTRLAGAQMIFRRSRVYVINVVYII